MPGAGLADQSVDWSAVRILDAQFGRPAQMAVALVIGRAPTVHANLFFALPVVGRIRVCSNLPISVAAAFAGLDRDNRDGLDRYPCRGANRAECVPSPDHNLDDIDLCHGLLSRAIRRDDCFPRQYSDRIWQFPTFGPDNCEGIGCHRVAACFCPVDRWNNRSPAPCQCRHLAVDAGACDKGPPGCLVFRCVFSLASRRWDST